ncbi:MAG: tetratricopeptide repeat protein, partial [Verrucomicrobiales bacterium]|nr:tetratricopeptide repeat protein [Verrucomicrobiales bacterium]
ILISLFLSTATLSALDYTEQIAVETFAGMRELERYQLKVAEKFYQKGEFAIALDEYDKFLTLYETSQGAPYAQLMWSHCQRKLRKVNTAVRDGFRSVIDYWPESPEAVLAEFLIAECQRSMGEVETAGKTYRAVIVDHPQHHVALLSKLALLQLAKIAKNEEKRLAMLNEFTFATERTKAANSHCINASRELASHYLHDANLGLATRALATSYPQEKLFFETQNLAGNAIRHLLNSERQKDANGLITFFLKENEARIPDDLTAEENRTTARSLLYRIASLHATTGDDDTVFDTYNRVVKLLGEDDEILGRIAGFHKTHNRRDEARRTYARFKDTVAGTRNIVTMLREESKWDAAIAGYTELITLDPPRSGEYQWAIAECYESSNQLRAAVAAFRLTDNFPSNYFRMASCQRRLKDFPEALTLYGQIKSSGNSAAEADIQIGYTWEEAEKKQNAIKAFQLTCKTHPKSAQASRAHAHLQDKYGISITLGGAKDQ